MEQSEKELVLGLLGSTFGELKQLDDSIVGTSSTLGRRSNDVRLELQKMVNANFTPPPPPPAIPIAQSPTPSNAYATIPATHVVVEMPKVEAPRVDNNQLEFDFDRKARYVEVVDALQTVSARLDNIDSKLDTILELICKSESIPQVKRPYKKKEQVLEPVPQPELKKK